MKLLQSKKGFGMPMGKMPSLILGIILIIGGGLSIFGEMLLGLTLPPIPITLLEVLIVIGGLLLILDGMKGVGQGMTQLVPKNVNMGLGVIVFLGGVALLLMRFGVIPALATVPAIVLHSIMLVAGVVLFFDGLLGGEQM